MNFRIVRHEFFSFPEPLRKPSEIVLGAFVLFGKKGPLEFVGNKK